MNDLLLLDLAKMHQADLRAEAASERLARAARASSDATTNAGGRRLVESIRSWIGGLGGQRPPTMTAQRGSA